MIMNIADILRHHPHQNEVALDIFKKHKLESRVTYGQLNGRIDQLTYFFQQQGYQKGDRVILWSHNSLDLILHVLALIKASCVPVLVNPGFQLSWVNDIAKKTQAKRIFCEPDKIQQTSSIPLELLTDEKSLRIQEFSNMTASHVSTEDVALILCTTGSVGMSKIVEVTHANLLWLNKKKVKKIKEKFESLRWLITGSISHMSGLSNLILTWSCGGSATLISDSDPANLFCALKESRANFITIVPTLMIRFLKYVKTQETTADQWKSVQLINLASAALTSKLIDEVQKVFTRAKINNPYGMTEAGAGLFGIHPDGKPKPLLSVGYPRKDIECKLVDSVLHLKAPSISKKIISQNGENQDFDSEGFYITKDIFEVDQDGFYFFKGRSDERINCGGYKFFPSDLEEIILRHPGVEDCSVIALFDEEKGQKPHAFVVYKTEVANADEQNIQNYCMKSAPAYMHPRNVWKMDSLPLNAAGKVDKKKLSELGLQLLRGDKL